jgi:hypothetical protein
MSGPCSCPSPCAQGCYGPEGACRACPERWWCNHNGEILRSTEPDGSRVRSLPIPGVCIKRVAPGQPCVPDGENTHRDNPCQAGHYCSQKQRVCLKQAAPEGECRETLVGNFTADPYAGRSAQFEGIHNRFVCEGGG